MGKGLIMTGPAYAPKQITFTFQTWDDLLSQLFATLSHIGGQEMADKAVAVANDTGSTGDVKVKLVQMFTDQAQILRPLCCFHLQVQVDHKLHKMF